MLIERDPIAVEIGSIVSTTAEPVPEIRVGADEGRHGCAQSEESAIGQGGGSGGEIGFRAARIGRAVVAYSVAGLIGWGLYDLAPPARIAWPDVSGLFALRNSAEDGELLRQMKKITGDLQSLQSRIDAIEALEKARGLEAKNVPSMADANRRIDEVRAGVDAQIGALSNQIREIKHDVETKAIETRPAAAEQSGKLAGPGVEDGRPIAPATKHIEAESKHVSHRRHDAFDPVTDPTAPGAPRPLGGGLSRTR
jgi:hypothetical protein